MKIKPFLLEVDDYHDFDEAVLYFNMAGIKLKFKEICGQKPSHMYYAVGYIGNQNKQVKDFIEQCKRELNEN